MTTKHRVNRAHWTTKENSIISSIFPAHAKNDPKWGREVLFPTNPDLADILGDMDFDFENFYFLGGSQISGLGSAWAHPLGPGLGPPTWARHGHTHLGPSWKQLGWGPHFEFMEYLIVENWSNPESMHFHASKNCKIFGGIA